MASRWCFNRILSIHTLSQTVHIVSSSSQHITPFIVELVEIVEIVEIVELVSQHITPFFNTLEVTQNGYTQVSG